MRTRTSGTISLTSYGVVTLTATNHSGVTWYPETGGFVLAGQTKLLFHSGSNYPMYQGRRSDMTDTIGPGLHYRDCNHVVTDWAGTSPHTFGESRRDILPGRLGTPCDVSLLLEGTVSADFWLNQDLKNVGTLFTTPHSVIQAQARGKLTWGSIEPYIDLPRSIAELKDFKGVFKNLLSNIRRISSTFKGIPMQDVLSQTKVSLKREGRRLKAKLPKGPGEWVDAGISADLTWKFAIAPLIADVNRVMELSSKADKLIEALSKSQTFAIKGRVAQTANQSKVSIDPNGKQNAYLEYSGTHTCVAWVLLEMHAAEPSFMEALRAVAGLNLRFRTAWELVPLSFVVDWFVKVGDQISHWDSGTGYQRTFSIVSSGYSHKKEFTGVGRVSMLPTAAPQLGAPWIATPVANSVVKNVSYSRQASIITPAELTLPPPLEFGLPNMGQIWTLMELIRVIIFKK